MADLIYMAKSKWTALLNAIRTKGGTSALMTVDQAKAAVDAIPSGGGGVPLTKLTEIEVSTNVRSIAIEIQSAWLDYDYLLIKYDLTLSASDWIYAGASIATTGQCYTSSSVQYYKYVSVSVNNGNETQPLFPYFVGPKLASAIAAGASFYLFTYSPSKSIVSGSSVTIYGGYNVDL